MSKKVNKACWKNVSHFLSLLTNAMFLLSQKQMENGFKIALLLPQLYKKSYRACFKDIVDVPP